MQTAISDIVEDSVLSMITSQKNEPWPLDVPINITLSHCRSGRPAASCFAWNFQGDVIVDLLFLWCIIIMV